MCRSQQLSSLSGAYLNQPETENPNSDRPNSSANCSAAFAVDSRVSSGSDNNNPLTSRRPSDGGQMIASGHLIQTDNDNKDCPPSNRPPKAASLG